MTEQIQQENPVNWHVILRPNHDRKVVAKSKLYRLRNNQPERVAQLEQIVGDAQFKYNRFKRVIDAPDQHLVEKLRQACIELIGHDRDLVHYLIAIAIERSEAAHRRGKPSSEHAPASKSAPRQAPYSKSTHARSTQARAEQPASQPRAAGKSKTS